MPKDTFTATTPAARKSAPASTIASDEPRWVAHTFEEDPMGAARNALVERVASSAEAVVPTNRVAAYARRSWALQSLGSLTLDDKIRDVAGDAESAARSVMAEIPARTWHEVALKLAIVVQQTACHGSNFGDLKLIAGVLADVVVLGDTPIDFPDRTLDRIVDDNDVAHWRKIAAEHDSPGQ